MYLLLYSKMHNQYWSVCHLKSKAYYPETYVGIHIWQYASPLGPKYNKQASMIAYLVEL